MNKVIIFGTSIFADLAHFYLKHDSKYDVVAFTVNERFLNQKNFNGLPVLAFENIEKTFPPDEYDMFIAVAYQNVNKIRAKIFQQAKKKGYKLISYVNSTVKLWEEVDLGENCFIFENVVIQPHVKIGNDVIIWSGDHIGHHSEIADHCFITSHVVISGNVKIGPFSFLGVNSTIRDGIKIGAECVIGAGCVILNDTLDKEVYSVDSTKLLPIKSDKLRRI